MLRRRMMMGLIYGSRYEGVFAGKGTSEVTIPIDFEPDYIYVKRNNQTIEHAGINGVYGFVVLRDMYYFDSYTNATTGNIINGLVAYDINGLLGSEMRGATYENGILTIKCSPANSVMHDGEEYKIICGKFM